MSFTVDITYFAVVGALTLRLGTMAATLPLLDQRAVPFLWRLALGAVLALALAPGVIAGMPPLPVSFSWPLLVGEAVRSLLAGALLALAVNLVFTAVRYAGNITGMQIGFAIVNTVDPQSGTQISVIAQLYYLLAVLIFFALNAHHVLLGAIYQSCTVLPLFAPLDTGAGAWFMIQEYGAIFALGLRIAAPVVIVLLLVSATMGVIVKTVPQINVLVVGFPIKIGVGLLMIGLSMVFFKQVVVGLLLGMEGKLDAVLLALRV